MHGSALSGGRWERIYAVINAEAYQERIIQTKVGMEKSFSETFGVEIETEASASIAGIFSTKVNTKTSFS